MKYFFKCRICGCEDWARDRTPVDLQILRSEVCTDCLKIVHGIEYICDENEDLGITPIPASIPEPDDTIYDQLDIAGALNTLAISSEDATPDDEDDSKYLDAALTRAYYAGVVAALKHINHKED